MSSVAEIVSYGEIAKAWGSVTDEWVVRRNKARVARQWEVVHVWGPPDIVDDATMEVVQRFALAETAEVYAVKCEVKARSEAVLDYLRQRGVKV